MSDWLLHEADCRVLLPTLVTRSFGAVITDPPYGLGFPYEGYEDTRESLRDLIAATWEDLRRVADRVYVLPGITQAHLYPEPDWMLAVTWDTTNSHGKYGFTQWMPVLCYGKDVDGFARLDNGLLKSDRLNMTGAPGGVGFQRSPLGRAGHPCAKPLNIMRMLVRRLTRPGEVILDPFAGIGTTLLAAVEEGRGAVGIEQAPAYARVARERLACIQRPLFAT